MLIFRATLPLHEEKLDRIQKDLVRQAKTGLIVIPYTLEVIATDGSDTEIIVAGPKGQWLPKMEDGSPAVDEAYGHAFECSICGNTDIGSTYEEECKLQFCSSCGTKMEAWPKR